MDFRNVITIVIVAFFVLILVCWIGNIILVKRRGTSSSLLTTGLYLFGIAATACNLIRVVLLYEGSRGVMIATNLIALVCIIAAMIRARKGDEADSEEA